MNYIIFNNDGSIKNIGFADIIVQGDDNTDEIYCAIEGRSNDAYLATAYFELPNGDSNSLSGVASSFSVDGSPYQGYKITLTASQTVFAGNVRMSLRLEGTGIKWTYNVILTINESGYDPDEVAITMAQYHNLVTAMGAKQDKYVINNARFYASLEAAQADLENLAINQCFIVANPAQPSVYPKIYFKTTQGTAQELNTLGQFNTPTTNVSTSTLPEGSDATASVTASSSGNDWSLAFSFGIPKGDKGDKGNKGDSGQDGKDGDYVSYYLGDLDSIDPQAIKNSASSYFGSFGLGQPFGQTCYAVDSYTQDWEWFLAGSEDTLTYISNGTINVAKKRLGNWKSTACVPDSKRAFGSFVITTGLYVIEYTPSGSTVVCTTTISISDTSKTIRSATGTTSGGAEWLVVYEPTQFLIYESGTLVSSPSATYRKVAGYLD